MELANKRSCAPKNRASNLLGSISGSVVAMAMCATPAYAQVASEQAAVDDNTIIVTAQRRSEALENVPMTVAVLSPEILANSGVASLRDIANVTTGVQLAQGGAYPQPAIRGVSTLLNGTFENNVAVYVDGLYQPSAQAINIDLPNVASVQVLKGPQGTLYGRNATGGAILLNTISPSDHWEGKAELTYARFDDKRASAYVAGPISDRVGVSLAGYIRRSEGYVKLMSPITPGKHDGNAAPLKQDAIRAKLTFDATDTLKLSLGYSYIHVNDGRGNMFSTYENVAKIYTSPGGNTRPTKIGEAVWGIGTDIDTKQHEGSLIAELDTNIGQIKSTTGYSELKAYTSFDFDGSYIPAVWSESGFKQKTFQQSLDYNIDAIERVVVLFGLNYFRDRLRSPVPSTFYIGPAYLGQSYDPTQPDSLSNYIPLFAEDYQQDKDALAAYGDATFHLTDRLTLNVGARFSTETQRAAGVRTGAGAITSNGSKASYSKLTPRASVRYELANRTNVYASYSQGFRSGTFGSNRLPGTPDFQKARQEVINAYELGFKTAARGLQFEAAAFYYDYKDFQTSVTSLDNSGSVITIIGNAPSAEIYGAEGSFTYEPVQNFTLRGGVTYLHARYGDDFLTTGTGVSNSAAQGGGIGLNTNADPLKTYLNVSQIQDLSGLQMSRAPTWNANLGANYLVEMGQGGLMFAVNGKYTSSYVVTNPSVWGTGEGVPLDRQREQRFREKRFLLVNAAITFTDPSDSFYARVWGNNLSDHRYRLHYNGTTDFGTYAPMAEPRTYGLTLGYKFGK